MKKYLSFLLALALVLSFALIPLFPVKADTAVNRNEYATLDHSNDERILSYILSMGPGSNMFPSDFGFNGNNFGGLMLCMQYTHPEIIGWVTSYHKTCWETTAR